MRGIAVCFVHSEKKRKKKRHMWKGFGLSGCLVHGEKRRGAGRTRRVPAWLRARRAGGRRGGSKDVAPHMVCITSSFLVVKINLKPFSPPPHPSSIDK